MLRPRDSHDLRLIQTNLEFSPPASVSSIHDVFGNSIAIASFAEPSAELRIESSLKLESYVVAQPASQVAQEAGNTHSSTLSDDRIDLGRLRERQYIDPNNRLGSWAQGFVRSNPTDTFSAAGRFELRCCGMGVLSEPRHRGDADPVETLNRGWGSCRDLAVLLIEAARSLGFGARVVTGYLYNPGSDGYARIAIGAGTTHAWADIYLPGTGWVA